MTEPESPRHRVRVRYVVEQNVTVEADDPVQARKPDRDRDAWLAADEPLHA